jgi:hypothetical protein
VAQSAEMHEVEHAGVDRATQGFVANLSWLRQRPALMLLEVAWRWCFGIPALLLTYRSGALVFSATPWQATGIENLTVNQLLTDPLAASTTVASFMRVVGPGLYDAAIIVVPFLLLLWAVVSGLGRTLVLKRMDSSLHARPLTMIVLQLLRVLPLAAAAVAWWLGLRAVAQWSIQDPIAAGGEPQIMLYVGGAIALTLGLFVLSAAVGWIFSIAPLLAMIHNTGAVRSLRDALNIGHLRDGLVEINMVMGIVKIALLVLAMVFSACPLPFQSVTSDEFLFWWNVAVAAWYFLASDFFHVARLSAYLHLWQATHGSKIEA